MDFLISSAYAQTAGAPADGGLISFLPIAVMFAVAYFVLLRPQMKSQKEKKAMIDALTKGAEVVTVGGVLGKVTKVGESYVTLEIANGVEIIVQKNAVSMVLPTGSMKSI